MQIARNTHITGSTEGESWSWENADEELRMDWTDARQVTVPTIRENREFIPEPR